MALEGSVALQQLERMGRELKCPICLSLFKEAVILSCTHCFCKPCILTAMKGASQCPVCKVPTNRREVRASPQTDNLVAIYRSMEAAAGTQIFTMQDENRTGGQQKKAPKKQGKPSIHENGSKTISAKKRIHAPQVETEVENVPPDNGRSEKKRKRKAVKTKQDVGVIGLNELNDFETDLVKAGEWSVRTCCAEQEAAKVKSPPVGLASHKDEQRNRLAPFFWLSSEEQLTQPTPNLSASEHVVPSFSDLKSSEDHGKDLETEEVSNAPKTDPFSWTQRPCSPELHCTTHNELMNLFVEDSQDPYLPIAQFLESEKKGDAQKPDEASTKDVKKRVQSLQGGFWNHLIEPTTAVSLMDDPATICGGSSAGVKAATATEDVQVAAKNIKATFKSKVRNKAKRKGSPNRKELAAKRVGQKRIKKLENAEKNVTKSTSILPDETTPVSDGADRAERYSGTETVPVSNEPDSAERYSGTETVPVSNEPDSAAKQTISLEQSCAFCQGSGNSSICGELLWYQNGALVPNQKENISEVLAVHKLCAEWAPDVYFTDENETRVRNLDQEVARSQKLKCSSCGLKGAALGCFLKRCRKTYHYHCAKALSDCKWNMSKFIIYCPDHAKCTFPALKEKKRNSTKPPEELNVSETPRHAKEAGAQGWSAPPSKWVLCGSALDAREKEALQSFASLTGAAVAKSWNQRITHVVAGTDSTGAARRTMKLLMGILEGKWIVKPEWMKACSSAGHPVDEAPFEVSSDIHGPLEGPERGRKQTAKLFDGLSFYFTPHFDGLKADLQSMIQTGGGTVLYRKPVPGSSGPGPVRVVYEEDGESKHKSEAVSMAKSVGGAAVGHSWVLNSIAAFKLQPLS